MTNQTVIQTRCCMVINTDPQRRCYNGVNAKEEMIWSSWYDLEHVTNEEEGNERINFWKDLNDFAVSLRGESAKREFRLRT